MNIKGVCIFFVLLCLSTFYVAADDVIEDLGTGGINWTKGYAFAHGYGVSPKGTRKPKQRLLARRAAQVDAQRNMGEILSGVRVTSVTLVKDMETASDDVKTKLEAVVKGAEMVSDQYQNEVATVTLHVKLDGEFYKTVKDPNLHLDNQSAYLPEILWRSKQLFKPAFAAIGEFTLFPNANASEVQSKQLIMSTRDLEFARSVLTLLQKHPQDQVMAKLTSEIDTLESQFAFTGLLIDARGVTDFKLATIPKIRNSEGEIIYPKDDLLSGKNLSRRPVSYDFDVEDAIRNERVAINPLVIKARGVYEYRFSDLVIDTSDSNAIAANEIFNNVISKASVMIVVAD